MFERRLRLILVLFTTGTVLIVGRLAQLQIVQGEYYRQKALDAVELPPVRIPFVRGSILERGGEVLVSDEPAWDLTVEYSVILHKCQATPAALQREYKRWRRKLQNELGPDAVVTADLVGGRLEQTWADLAEYSRSCGLNSNHAEEAALEICQRVQTIRESVARNRGFDAPVAEESTAHVLIGGLSAAEQIAARERLGAYPWVHIEASSQRRFGPDTVSFAHVLGRMGPVDAQTVLQDPDADDPFRRYLADEKTGISGVEWAAERWLRGRRGQLSKDRQDQTIEEIAAENGSSARLSIVGPLQRRLYDLLGSAVHRHPDSNGGAIVVLDVHTREVLALVSYPAYDPSRFSEDFELLRDDTVRLPLRFRAITTRYQPGSTVKPLACLSGFFHSVITPQTTEMCSGALFPEHPDRWRCWEIHGTTQRMVHDLINVEQALTGSCNVFLYRLGEKLGVERLTSTFDMVGIGRPSGIGLREDEPGINPTASWLMANRNMPASAGAARLYAIGQAEISMTPIQVANLMATYANGRYRPVTLLMQGLESPEWTLPGTADQWAAIRRGVYGVVNDPEGTAHKYAYFEHPRYALCGKTGSATATPWPTAYRVRFVDEYLDRQVEIVKEGAKGPALERFRRDHPLAKVEPADVEPISRWPESPPEDGENHAHAWFAGFLQPLDEYGQPDWSKTPTVAFAALVEFGGSGGRTSGPLAKEIVSVLLEVLGDDLDGHRKESGL